MLAQKYIVLRYFIYLLPIRAKFLFQIKLQNNTLLVMFLPRPLPSEETLRRGGALHSMNFIHFLCIEFALKIV